jgi:hypothetical protein
MILIGAGTPLIVTLYVYARFRRGSNMSKELSRMQVLGWFVLEEFSAQKVI